MSPQQADQRADHAREQPAARAGDADAGTGAGLATGRSRSVGAHLRVAVDAPATLVLALAVASGPDVLDEHLQVTLDGEPVDAEESVADVGGRLHVVRAAAGELAVDYRATVGPAPGRDGAAARAGAGDLAVALRPSRYADSDRLAAVAAAEFGHLRGQGQDAALADAVTAWVHERLAYVAGSTRGTDAASDALLAGAGVCRDFAHLVAGLLRALDVPTRVAGVYAPGLAPMDLHAVAEAWVAGAWHVLDATRLAPRQSLVRVATGRDTADTAFLSNSGAVRLLELGVTAVLDQPARPGGAGAEGPDGASGAGGPVDAAFPLDPGGPVVLG